MRHNGIFTGLTLLSALFFLASCINTDHTLGSAFVPDSQDISVHTITLDLPLGESRPVADLQSQMSSSVTVGSLGTAISSEGLMSVNAATDSIIWGRNPSVHRVYLSFSRDTTLILQDDQLYIPQNLYVHQLTFELDSTHANGSLDIFKGEYYTATPVSDGGCVYTGDDIYIVDLKKSVGERLLQIPMEVLDSAELFMKQFYGFCLRTEQPDSQTDGNAGRLTVFDLSGSSLYLVWDYDDENGNRLRSTASFQLGQYYSLNLYRNGGTPADNGGDILVRGLSGNKPRIEAASLRKAVTDWAAADGIALENLVVAKATVEFPFEYDGDLHRFDHYADNLFPCRRTLTDGLPYYTPIEEINDTDLENGSIDRSLLRYKSNISLYLQDILQRDAGGLTDEDDLWMMPTTAYYNSYTGATYYYADNVYYSQTVLNGTAAERHPVLKLTYSVLK